MSCCRAEENRVFILKTNQPYFQLPALTSALRLPGSQSAQVPLPVRGKATRVPEVLGTTRLEISLGSMAKGAASHLIPHVFQFLHTCFLPRFKVHSLGRRAGPGGHVGVVLLGMDPQTSSQAEPGSLPQSLLNCRILMLEVSLRPLPSTRRQESLPLCAGEEAGIQRQEGTCPRAHSR